MPNALQQSENGNYVLGAGRIFFKRSADDHFRYIMSTPDLTLTANTEVANLYSFDSAVATKIFEVETQRDYEGSFASHDINLDNLGIFFGGEVESVSQTSAAVTDEAVTSAAVAEGVYQLGIDATHPDGKRTLTAITIDDGAGTTFVAGDDYILDAELGLLRILAGGAAVGEAIEANYTYGTVTYRRLSASGVASARGYMLFVPENNQGEQIAYRLPNVIIRANGDLMLKSRDEAQGIPFNISVNADSLGRTVVVETPPEAS